MNFDYIKEAEPSTDDLRQLYDSLYQNLEKAEELYWTKPQRCGMMLRKATEKICRIYNGYYEINFPESATLEEYLCYTGDDDHNAMVSRFLSVVRKSRETVWSGFACGAMNVFLWRKIQTRSDIMRINFI